MVTKKKRRLVRVRKETLEANLRKAVRTAYHAAARYGDRVNFNAAIALIVEESAKQRRLESERLATRRPTRLPKEFVFALKTKRRATK